MTAPDKAFELEPTAGGGGPVPDRVIEQLRQMRATAKDYAGAFSDAVKEQAEKHDIKTSALRKYVCALEDDKLEDVDAECDDLARLIG